MGGCEGAGGGWWGGGEMGISLLTEAKQKGAMPRLVPQVLFIVSEGLIHPFVNRTRLYVTFTLISFQPTRLIIKKVIGLVF